MKNKTNPSFQTSKKVLYTDKTSIFDVSYKEIAQRQFFAGFMAGLGGVLATLLVGFVATVIIAGIVSPRLNTILTGTKTTLERAGFFTQPSFSPEQQ